MARQLDPYRASSFQSGPTPDNSIYDQLGDATTFLKKRGVQQEKDEQRVANNISAADLMQLGGTVEEMKAGRDDYFSGLDPNLVDIPEAMSQYDDVQRPRLFSTHCSSFSISLHTSASIRAGIGPRHESTNSRYRSLSVKKSGFKTLRMPAGNNLPVCPIPAE